MVVDDGSTDNSCAVVQAVAQQDTRVKLLRRHQGPKGAPTCRNIGAERANGEYLIFLDSDDLLAPFCLKQRITQVRRHPEVDFLVFSMVSFQQTPGDSSLLWNVATPEDDLARFLRGDGVWQTSCLIHRKSAFLRAKGFKEGLPYWQDYELHVRMLAQNPSYQKLMHLAPDCFYRQHDGATLSQTSVESSTRLKITIHTYRQLTDLLVHYRALTEARRRSLRGMYLRFSINQIMSDHSIGTSLSNWQYGCNITQECLYRRVVGQGVLWVKFWSVRWPSGRWRLGLVYKLAIRLLPRNYRSPKITMHKIKYVSTESAANQTNGE